MGTLGLRGRPLARNARGEFGAARTWGVEITAGRGTSYTGSVSSLDAEHFAEHNYAYGLLTYTAGSSPPFQVVDYWVQ